MILIVEKRYQPLENSLNQLLEELSELSGEQLQFKPSEDSWSILEVLDHAYKVEKGTFFYIKKKTKYADELPMAGLSSSLSSFILNTALRSSFKFEAPTKYVQPDEDLSFVELREEWDELRDLSRRALDMIDVKLAKKLIFKHPMAGMLNILQTLTFLQAHFDHHLKQIERIRKNPEFPAQ